MSGRHPTTARVRFDEKVASPNERGCRLWTGGRTGNDEKAYGLFYADGQMRPAHRWQLEQKLGHALPRNIDACHRCDVRLCVEESHLFPGTRTENMQDAVRKGRTSHVARNSGEKHPMARLDWAAVRLMREQSRAGVSHETLAGRFDISLAHTYRILNNESWKEKTP